ncbi:hypothetical protein HMPREF3224_01931 [Anaerococcus hydrogenalis]|nr:hypothetical protein HMPREF3224_01931 [Anaerococcus hydrogenalis]
MNDILKIKSLSKSLNDFYLGPLDLKIKRGSIVGYIGENGAGDSDIMMTDTINPLKSKFKASTKLLNKTI